MFGRLILLENFSYDFDMDEELKRLFELNVIEVNEQIKNFLPKKLDKLLLSSIVGDSTWDYHLEACNGAIINPVWDLLSRGGKRWRPLLMKFAYNSVGGNGDEINKFLILPELIHNGTLIVDDVEDSSENRRGLPCIHKIFGNDVAINAGNILYYLPMLCIAKDSSLNYELKSKIYELVNEEMVKLSFGQGTDIYWHSHHDCEISEDNYLQMCAYKTGTLARMAAKLGAILGHASEKQISALGVFAEIIGVAFQIQDDILNITRKDWGKDFGEDITEGKKSLIVIKTLEWANEEDKNRLKEILKMRTHDKDLILQAINILEKYGAIEYSKKRARELVNSAWRELDFTLENSDAKLKLKLFADYLIERDY